MARFQRLGSHQRLILLISLSLLLLVIIYLTFQYSPQSRETAMMVYPENFLTMSCIDTSNDNTEDIPLVYANGKNANGSFRIAHYKNFDTFEEQYSSGDWIITQSVYKNANYVTSEGISVGSNKKGVVASYKKYGYQEYNISKIASMNLSSLDIALKGVDLANTFIYVDNHNIFNDSYKGTDYWGGLGAIIFILDQNNEVAKIVE